MRSVWYVVDAINGHMNFDIKYPSNTDMQQSITTGFEAACWFHKLCSIY